MKDILLIGDTGSGSSASSGAGACIARTRRFSRALEDEGFRVIVCSPPEGKQGARQISELVESGNFSCAVAISPFPAECAVLSKMDLPLWIDMNGMHPAELQMQDRSDPRYLERLYRMLSLENLLLGRGDAFSAPSRRQSYALYAELLLLGRHSFCAGSGAVVFPIPHSAEPFRKSRRPDSDEFTIISTGSFNVWFDEQTLFKALEHAMGSNGEVNFVATGGALPFSRDRFSRFSRMVEGSPHGSRFHLRGWVEESELEDIYLQADAAVYTDVPSPETFLGARTRALDWICRGIPVVCTDGAEISGDIAEHGLGLRVPQGDWKSMGEAFLRLADDRELRSRISRSQEEWCAGPASPAEVFKPLVEWCRSPQRDRSSMLGRSTVKRMGRPEYLLGLFRTLSESAGRGYAVKRMLRKLGLLRFSV